MSRWLGTNNPGTLTFLLIPFALGIASAHLRFPDVSGLVLVFLGAAGAGGLLLASIPQVSRRFSSRIFRGAVLAGAMALFFALGAWDLRFTERILDSRSSDLLALAARPGAHVLTGQILRAPVPRDTGTRLFVQARLLHEPVRDIRVSGLLSLSVERLSYRDLAAGDWIRFSARLRPVRNFATQGTFDRQTWWAIRGVRVTGFASSPLAVTVVGHGKGSAGMWRPRYWLETARHRLMAAVEDRLPGREGGIALAMLAGEGAWVSQGLREIFSRAGVSHLLAVSGLHMGLAAVFIGGGLRWVLLRFGWIALRGPVQKIAAAVALLAVLVYAGMAGFSPSAVRAAVMLGAFGLAFLIDRPQASMNSLALAGWVLLVAQPLHLASISFQLSFVAVFFLLCLADWLKAVKGREAARLGGWIPERLRVFLLVTLVASCATAPLVAWHFQLVSLAAVPANLVMVPVGSLAVLPGLLAGALLLPFWESGAALVWGGTGTVIAWALDFVTWVAHWPYAAVWVARPGWLEVALFLLVLGLILRVPKGRMWLFGFAMAVLCLLAACLHRQMGRIQSDTVRVHVLDVGQGLCQVLELPGGRLMVVDGGGAGGGDFDVGARVVAPFLRCLGYTKIDTLVYSHPEEDHIGGLAALVEQFHVGELWSGEGAPASASWQRLMAVCRRKGIPHREWRRDGAVLLGPVSVEVGTAEGCARASSFNARSLTIMVRFKGLSLFFPGDIDASREQCMGDRGLGAVDFLVVPHHGSATSSSLSFVQTLRPAAAAISVGWRNGFGLPKSEVVRRYESAGTAVFRTDRDGTVRVTAGDDGTVRIRTARGGEVAPFVGVPGGTGDSGEERI